MEDIRIIKALQLDASIDEIKNLIRDGVDVNARDKSDKTAIFYAKTREQIEALVAVGIDINAQDKCGRKASDYFSRKNKDILIAVVDKINLEKRKKIEGKKEQLKNARESAFGVLKKKNSTETPNKPAEKTPKAVTKTELSVQDMKSIKDGKEGGK